MTIKEKEEKGNSANTTKVVEIKKENPVEEEEEEDINNLQLNDLNIDEKLQICASNSQSQIEKAPINEESERPTKRTRTRESEEEESATENAEYCESEWGKDPLLAIEEIVTKYHEFIDYVYQILKEEEQKEEELKIQWRKWSEILDRGKLLVKAVKRSLKTVALEMECLEAVEHFRKQYRFRKTHIPNLLTLLKDINSRIESSNNFRLVSDMKNKRKVLWMCLRELERSKQELSEMIEIIQVLKELDLQLDDDDDDEEEETE